MAKDTLNKSLLSFVKDNDMTGELFDPVSSGIDLFSMTAQHQLQARHSCPTSMSQVDAAPVVHPHDLP